MAWERRIEIVPRPGSRATGAQQGRRARLGAGAGRADPAVVGLHARRVRRARLRLRVREPVGGRARPAARATPTVDKLVGRTRRRVGFHFTAHQFRHTYATLAYRDGVALEVIGTVLTHRSPSSARIYTHPTAEDLRTRARRARGARPGRGSGRMSAEPLRVLEGGRRRRAAGTSSGGATSGERTSCPTATSRAGGGAILHFDGLVQPWLKEAARRWARAPAVGLDWRPETMQRLPAPLRAFSRWLAEAAPELGSPAGDHSRAARGLRAVRPHRRPGGRDTKRAADRGAAGVPRGAARGRAGRAAARRGDPRRRDPEGRLPAAEAARAAAVRPVRRPANLALLASEQHRTVVLLLATTGLRVSSVAHARAATRWRSARTATPTCATATSSCAAKR